MSYIYTWAVIYTMSYIYIYIPCHIYTMSYIYIYIYIYTWDGPVSDDIFPIPPPNSEGPSLLLTVATRLGARPRNSAGAAAAAPPPAVPRCRCGRRRRRGRRRSRCDGQGAGRPGLRRHCNEGTTTGTDTAGLRRHCNEGTTTGTDTATNDDPATIARVTGLLSQQAEVLLVHGEAPSGVIKLFEHLLRVAHGFFGQVVSRVPVQRHHDFV